MSSHDETGERGLLGPASALRSPGDEPSPTAIREVVESLQAHVRYEYMPAKCRDTMDQAASLIRQLVEERDAWEAKYRIQYKGASDAMNIADDETARADAAEAHSLALEQKLAEAREVLRGIANYPSGGVGANPSVLVNIARAFLSPSNQPAGRAALNPSDPHPPISGEIDG